MGRVLAIVDDLFFRTKIVETARHVGVELACFATPKDLVDEFLANPPALVILDLNLSNDPFDALERLPRGNSVPLVAFLSHVQTDLAERARRAGCTAVMPRSQFSKELPAILAQAKNAP